MGGERLHYPTEVESDKADAAMDTDREDNDDNALAEILKLAEAFEPPKDSVDTAEAPSDQERKLSFDEVVAAIEARNPGKIYTYKNYSGTIAQVASQCPAIGVVVSQGVEPTLNFLAAYDGVPEDEESKEVDEQKSETTEELPSEKINDSQSRAEVVAQATEAVHQEYAKEETVPVEAVHITEPQNAAVPLEVSDEHELTSIPAVEEIVNSVARGDERESTATSLSEAVAAEDTVTSNEQGAETSVYKSIVQPTVIGVPGEVNESRDLVDEPLTSVAHEADDSSQPLADSITLEDNPITYAKDVSHEELGSIESEVDDQEPEMVIEAPLFDEKETIHKEVFHEFETSFDEHEVYPIDTVNKAEETIDTLEVSSAIQAGEVQHAVDGSDEVIVEEDVLTMQSESHEVTESIRAIFEHETEVRHDASEVAEQIEEAIEIATGFVEEAPEFEVVVTPTETIAYGEAVRQSIKKLEQAETKEECMEHVEALQKSLAELLDSLGFAHSQELARRLVRQYDTKTLKQFIAALMKSVTAGEVAQHGLQKQVLPVKHHWFGQRVVERVVRAATQMQLQAA